jgi:hypothetical protein
MSEDLALFPFHWQCFQRPKKSSAVTTIMFNNVATKFFFSTVNIFNMSGKARIFKRLWSQGIDSKEWIPPAYVA